MLKTIWDTARIYRSVPASVPPKKGTWRSPLVHAGRVCCAMAVSNPLSLRGRGTG